MRVQTQLWSFAGNTSLNLYFKRGTDHRRGENELKLTRMRYFMNFTGIVDQDPPHRLRRRCVVVFSKLVTRHGQDKLRGSIQVDVGPPMREAFLQPLGVISHSESRLGSCGTWPESAHVRERRFTNSESA